MSLCAGSLESGLLRLVLLIQWINITLALASGESAVFLNQGLLRGIAVGLGRCVVRRSKVKIF